MDATVILSLLTAEPFRPFRVTTSRSVSHVVPSPADALLTRTTLYIALGRDGDGIATGVALVALMQIAHAEPE